MIDFFKIQLNRFKNKTQEDKDFEECKHFIEAVIQTALPYPFKCQALYISKYKYTKENGFGGWEARIYSDSSPLFYDLIMDIITSDNIEYYVNHALRTMKVCDENVDNIQEWIDEE